VVRQQMDEDMEDRDSNEDDEATPMMSGVGRKEQNNRRSVVRWGKPKGSLNLDRFTGDR